MIDIETARKMASSSQPLVKPVENWDRILDERITEAAKNGSFEVRLKSLFRDFYEYAKITLRPVGFKVKPIYSQGFRDGGYLEGFRITWYPPKEKKS